MKQVCEIYDKAFKKEAIQLNYDRTNVLELASELRLIALQLYKWHKEFKKFGVGSFPEKGNLKQTLEN